MTTIKRTGHMMPLGLLSEGEKAEVLEIGGAHRAKGCCDDNIGLKPRCGQGRIVNPKGDCPYLRTKRSGVAE